MCAIFGVFFIKGDYARVRKQIVKMIKRLQNRGPDATGIKHVCLGDNLHHFIGHQRLSIVDPFNGDQPFYGQFKNTISVTNGEIYNHMQVI
jgi:asparagine synthase (glutamine-hydrolysing)